MDPTACLRRISDANRFRSRECFDACADLCNWIRRGGFQPDWESNKLGTARYERWYHDKKGL